MQRTPVGRRLLTGLIGGAVALVVVPAACTQGGSVDRRRPSAAPVVTTPAPTPSPTPVTCQQLNDALVGSRPLGGQASARAWMDALLRELSGNGPLQDVDVQSEFAIELFEACSLATLTGSARDVGLRVYSADPQRYGG